MTSFQHLLGVASEPTPAQCPLYSTEFKKSILNMTEVAFAMNSKNIEEDRLSKEFSCN